MARPGASRHSPIAPVKRAIGGWPLSREFQEGHQRRRVLIPVAKMAHELGIAEVGVTEACAGGRMARDTFYRLFANRTGMLEYVLGEAFEQTFGPVRSAAAEPGPWLQRFDAALGALFEGIAEKPLIAELCLVHATGAGRAAKGRDVEAGVELLAGILDDGRDEGSTGAAARPLVSEWLARGVLAMASQRIRQGATEELPGQREEMTLLAARFILGPEEAAEAWRELARRPQPASGSSTASKEAS